MTETPNGEVDKTKGCVMWKKGENWEDPESGPLAGFMKWGLETNSSCQLSIMRAKRLSRTVDHRAYPEAREARKRSR